MTTGHLARQLPSSPCHAGGAEHVRCAEGGHGHSRAEDTLRRGANARRMLLAPSSLDSTYALTGSLTGTSALHTKWLSRVAEL